jgi:hypothetical protein
LQIMPWVAAAKRSDNLPVRDEKQETSVLQKVRERAAQLQLEPETIAALFQVQIDLARAVQEHNVAVQTPEQVQLADLRLALSAISEQLLNELHLCSASLRAPQASQWLAAALQRDLNTPGLPADSASRLGAALGAVRSQQ